jgi:hypothetical protein
MKWHYHTNNKYFKGKFNAIDEYEKHKKALLLEVPDSYGSFDFTTEPKEDMQTLLKSEAVKVRERHDYIRLFYSGGADSHAVLDAFVNNGLHINEIVCMKSGFHSADYEIDQYAVPYLDSIRRKLEKTKIRILEPTINDYDKWYNGNWTDQYLEHRFASTVSFFRLMDQPYEFNDGALNIKAKDKPTMVSNRGKFYTYISDSIFETEHYMYHFLLENPAILSKQCHLLLKKFKNHPRELNRFFQSMDSQDTANSIIHNQEASLPLKQKHYLEGGCIQFRGKNLHYVNEKDRLALVEAVAQCPDAVEKWVQGVEDLRSSRFMHWFNSGRPELGTIGILSRFYGLDEKTIKTVDQLYPSGFTQQNIMDQT